MTAPLVTEKKVINLPAGHMFSSDGEENCVHQAYVEMRRRCDETVTFVVFQGKKTVAAYIDPLAAWEASLVQVPSAMHHAGFGAGSADFYLVAPTRKHTFAHLIYKHLKDIGLKNVKKHCASQLLIDLKDASLRLLSSGVKWDGIVHLSYTAGEQAKQEAHMRTTDRNIKVKSFSRDPMDKVLYGERALPFIELSHSRYKPMRYMGKTSSQSFQRRLSARIG